MVMTFSIRPPVTETIAANGDVTNDFEEIETKIRVEIIKNYAATKNVEITPS